jgi:hypothetical protein
LDPDPDWIRIGSGFSGFLDPDPESESGYPDPVARNKEILKKLF